jgi:hypothetical protein
MTGALLDFQRTIFTALGADAGLATLVGARIHDGAPRRAVAPFVAFGEARSRDWSTGSDSGRRLSLVIEAVSDEGGRSEALAVSAAVEAVVQGALPAMVEHRLVLLQVGETAVERLKDGRTWRARVRVDALVEAT